jgi:SNF2 family DNA or RNA helicase
VPVPKPHQLTGASFLSDRHRAYLADEPRVGKTGAAILAVDDVMAERVLVITTSSGRPVWRRAFAEWSPFGRTVQLPTDAVSSKTDAAIVSWGSITQPNLRSSLLQQKWDVVISDEAHFAKNFDAKRTQALYGTISDGGRFLDNKTAIASTQEHIWSLSGTPLPNSPFDLYPVLRALRPACLEARDGMPDVTCQQAFMDRYTRWRPKKLSAWNTIKVIMGGQNAEELKHRIGDFMLRRTQKDVGISEPITEIMPVLVSDRARRQFEADLDATKLLDAAEAGDTRTLEMHLGPLRRITGEIKAHAIVEAVKEEFECGLDKIVIAYWHKDAGAVLKDGLAKYGVVGIDGSSTAANREQAEQRFLNEPHSLFNE